MQQQQFLKSSPISSLMITNVSQEYAAACTEHLTALGCRVQNGARRGALFIQFPPGTIEAVYAGQSTSFTYRTAIIFPTGQRLTKLEVCSLPDTSQTFTMLAFPTDVLIRKPGVG